MLYLASVCDLWCLWTPYTNSRKVSTEHHPYSCQLELDVLAVFYLPQGCCAIPCALVNLPLQLSFQYVTCLDSVAQNCKTLNTLWSVVTVTKQQSQNNSSKPVPWSRMLVGFLRLFVPNPTGWTDLNLFLCLCLWSEEHIHIFSILGSQMSWDVWLPLCYRMTHLPHTNSPTCLWQVILGSTQSFIEESGAFCSVSSHLFLLCILSDFGAWEQ